jgi:hypothetical protein
LRLSYTNEQSRLLIECLKWCQCVLWWELYIGSRHNGA